MSDLSQRPSQTGRWRFWQRRNDDPVKVIGVAVLVAFFSAVLVSGAELLTMSKRVANIEALRASQMAGLLANLPGLESVLANAAVDSLETRIVDLTKGRYTDAVNPTEFNARTAESDPDNSMVLNPESDIAGIGSRANYATVSLLYRDSALELIILPVHGTGYQSVIRAWLTLAGDLNTVVAFTVFEQGETPGLGSRIVEETWLAQFGGKTLRDRDGKLLLQVVKGKSDSEFEVDGITGATRTGNAINHMIEFWLGDLGYGPYLTALRAGVLE